MGVEMEMEDGDWDRVRSGVAILVRSFVPMAERWARGGGQRGIFHGWWLSFG